MKNAPFLSNRLQLKATTAEDLQIISALLQDAIGKVGQIAWLPQSGILAMSLCRFSWETPDKPERHLCGMHFTSVTAFRAKGVTPQDSEQSFSILSIIQESPSQILITCAAGILFGVEVQKLDLHLQDRDKSWATAYVPHHHI